MFIGIDFRKYLRRSHWVQVIIINMRRLIFIIILVAWPIINLYLSAASGQAELIFFDVGQGDALALRTPAGKIIVVDGGPDWSSLYGLGKWLGLTNKKIDILILTHGHADHLIALPEIVARYGVTSAYLPTRLEIPAAQSLLAELQRSGAAIIYPDSNRCLQLETDCSLCIYPPGNNFLNSFDENDLSLITHFDCAGLSLLASGDAGRKREQELINTGNILGTKILKAGHHGSKTANSLALFEAVRPLFFLISVGKDNNYGHPSPEVLKIALSLGAKIWRTDQRGAVIFYTNNSNIYIDKP